VMSADEGRPDAGLYFSVPQLVTQSRRHGGTRCPWRVSPLRMFASDGTDDVIGQARGNDVPL